MTFRMAPIWISAILVASAYGAAPDEPTHVEAKAPENTVELRGAREGAWFVSEPLKQQYDALLGRVRALRADVDAERISGKDAERELEALQADLKRLREAIEKQKVLVAAVKVHQQSETTEFELGPARMLVLTADSIKVEGWDGPKVKCVLEKTVIAPDGKPVDADLRGLKLVHRHGPAPEIVGQPADARATEEAKFLASPDGAKLTPEQRQARGKLVEQIAAGYTTYRDFQGKEIDTVAIEGLTYEEGNRSVVMKFTSLGGGNMSQSRWQRHASLTVYVPKCNAVALRGGEVGLDVKGVHAELVVTSQGSRDRDYDGTFAVRDVHGPVTIDNAPLDVLERVYGNVTITGAIEMVNTGEDFNGDQRTAFTPPPRTLKCSNIDGDFTAWFVRSDLRLEGISGRIDVRNDFGDTSLVVSKGLPVQQAHRVVSQSGKVEVRFAKGTPVGTPPLLALTNCGTLRTNIGQDVLESTSFTVSRDAGDGAAVARGWRGLKSAQGKRDPLAMVETFERTGAIMRGGDRSAGLDLVSRAGVVKVIAEP
jgi:hypothetical protein